MNGKIKKLVLASAFLALGAFLPFLTMQIKEIGDSLLPMHFAIMLCGLFCGWKYGLFCGLLLPFFRSALFSMPPMYPNAVYMALELACYGAVISLFYNGLFKAKWKYIYPSLIISMLLGRIVWGVSKAFLLGLGGKAFTFIAFLTEGFVDAIPGIAIQLILIPLILKLFEKVITKNPARF